MKRIYLGLWDKYGDDNEHRLESVRSIVEAVEEFGES